MEEIYFDRKFIYYFFLDGQSHSEASMVGDGVVVGQDQNHPLSRRSTRLATTLRKLAATLRDLATTPRKKLAATPRKLSATLGKFAETPRKKFAETRRKKLAAIPQNFTATRILRSHNKSGNVSSTGERRLTRRWEEIEDESDEDRKRPPKRKRPSSANLNNKKPAKNIDLFA